MLKYGIIKYVLRNQLNNFHLIIKEERKMKKYFNLAAMCLLDEARTRFYDRPKKDKIIETDKLFYGLCGMMQTRMASMIPEKKNLDEKGQIVFKFRASIIMFDYKMMEIIMDEVPMSKGKDYLVYNDPANLLIDNPTFLASDYMKLLDKTLQEFERAMDEESRKIFKTKIEMSKDKDSASFEITFRVTPRNPMALPEYGSC